jgi:hypothetical protein
MKQLAEVNWIGIVVVLAAVAAQIFSSMRRGKVEPDDEEDLRPTPAPRREERPAAPPVSQQKEAKRMPQSLDELFQELSKGLDPSPLPKAEPVIVRRPSIIIPPTAPTPAPAPPVLASVKPQMRPSAFIPESDQPAQAQVLTNSAALFTTAVEKMESSSFATARVDHSQPHEWLRSSLRDQTELRRAFILKEILHSPRSLHI